MSEIVGSEAKRMRHHPGGLVVTKKNASEVRGLTTVGGDLFIDAAAPLSNLTTVGGDLVINADASLSSLTSVGGELVINADASLSNLTSVGGDLVINADAALSSLSTVGGRLSIAASRFDIEDEVSLPALTSVHGAAMPDPAVAHERLVAVARQVVAHPETLNMDAWHCDTSHCVGGWAIEQAGELGQNLTVLHGVQVAATLLLGVPGAQLFYLSNEAAMARLTKIASAQGPS